MNKLEVAIPTYNRELYLDKLLSSIPSEIRISVSDNGAFVTNELKLKYPNTTFISHNKILGIFENWNYAAKNNTSTWIIVPSDDDLFFDKAFETINTYIDKYPDADILIFGHMVIDGNGEVRGNWNPQNEVVYDSPHGYEVFKFGVNARMPSIIFKTSLLKKIDYFDSSYKLTAGDSDLVQQMLIYGKSVFIPIIISGYRVWEGGLTTKKIASKLWLSEIDYWQNKIIGILKSDFENFYTSKSLLRIKDEVYAHNLIGGILALKQSKGIIAAKKFMKTVRYPKNSKVITQLRIIKLLLIN